MMVTCCTVVREIIF